MGIYAVTISLILFGIIISIEAFRKKTRCYIDFLFPVNIMIIILFCLIPSYLLLVHHNDIYAGSYWIFKNSLNDTVFFLASLVSLLGYLAIIFGYFIKDIIHKGSGVNRYNSDTFELAKNDVVIKDKYLLIAGITLGIVGSLSLFVYAYSIGGIGIMIEYAGAFRGSDPPVVSKVAFLKKVAPLVIVSSYFFFALIQSAQTNIMRHLSRLLFVIMFFLSLLILFHQSGRLQLLAYFLVFPIAMMIRKDRLNLKIVLSGAILFIIISLLGKHLFHFFINPESVSDKVEVLSDNPLTALNYLFLEFVFPYVTLANTIEIVPTEVMYRWFSDIPISMVYLLPQRLLEIKDLPPTVTMINAESLNAPVPVDLISFGYFSMGLPGVLIVCFVYGLLMRIFDRLLPAKSDPIFVIFRTAWIMFFAYNVMYGNPHHILVTGFSLFIATATLFIIFRASMHVEQRTHN